MAGFRLIKGAWNDEILAARRANPGRLRIICPFIKAKTLTRILKATKSSEIEVITRFDLNCFDQGVSDLYALRLIIEAGGKVRGVRGLHSKLYLFGGTSVIATSANVTDAAFDRNHEFGFAAHELDIVETCEQYFEDLWKDAKPSLTRKQLKTWRAMLDERRGKGGGAKQGPPLPDFGANIDLRSPFAPTGDAAPQENNAFIKFFGSADRRAPRTLAIDELVAENGANWACTYPESKPPRQVEDGDVIYTGRLVHSPNDLLIFGRVIGRKHRDEEDVASAAEIALRPWKADWPRYVRVHGGRFLDGTLADGISMSEMMTSLGADAFESTQRNARDKSGNTDPFASYGRKAHMLLTDRSRAWIEERLEAALRRHGEIDLSEKRFRAPA
ncbi:MULTISPECIES: phospholipase D family protein [unclassified Sphingopyxis]|uniref:phospholipase D family protein n=1 Tax=unclassified Sphingopyxis TaxID=2614943 RepID=UPI0024AD0D3B|nr:MULTISPECIES: phospholipase D family protein [unclassified Sphingopyxis]